MLSDAHLPELGRNPLPTVVVLFLAELVGSFILVCFGCMGVCITIMCVMQHPHVPGITFGLAVMIAMNTVHHISGGHINPQITIGAAVLGKMKLILVPVYLLGQFLGAVLGMGLVKLVTPDQYNQGICLTTPHTSITILQALTIEITATFSLVLLWGAIMDRRNSNRMDSMPLRFGLAVTTFAIVAGPYTGASMNTARSFAPALIHLNWTNHWLYWIGPTIGSILGAAFYRWVLEPPIK